MTWREDIELVIVVLKCHMRVWLHYKPGLGLNPLPLLQPSDGGLICFLFRHTKITNTAQAIIIIIII